MCGTGFYSASGASKCLICPAGKYCESETTSPGEVKACLDGYICPEGLAVKPFNPTHACRKGYYCINSVEYQCLPGTYNPVLAASSSSYCL